MSFSLFTKNLQILLILFDMDISEATNNPLILYYKRNVCDHDTYASTGIPYLKLYSIFTLP